MPNLNSYFSKKAFSQNPNLLDCYVSKNHDLIRCLLKALQYSNNIGVSLAVSEMLCSFKVRLAIINNP